MSGPWIFSRNQDLVAFGGSAALSLLLVLVGIPLGLTGGDTPEWAWLSLIVFVDVAHVWGNLLLVYADPVELKRRLGLYLGIPAAGLAVGVALASEGELYFWRALATLAVFHFVRQQAGWVALYRGKNGELADGKLSEWIDKGAIYAATVGPLVWWHAHLPRPFWWLFRGDFFVELPPWTGTGALLVEVVFLGAYLGRSVDAWRRGRGNPGKDLVVATTALLWWLGIVALESDYAFTVTNVVIHGVPYVFLIAYTARRRRQAKASLSWPLRFSALGVVLALIACALVEELAWDRLLFHQRDWLFPLPAVDPGALRVVLLPLLALPQLTHYLLDGVLWRRRDNPYL